MIKALYLFSSKSISVFLLILGKFFVEISAELVDKNKTEKETRLQGSSQFSVEVYRSSFPYMSVIF